MTPAARTPPRWAALGRRVAGLAGAARTSGDCGTAIVEFLGISLVLLVPVVYLVLVLGRIQAATFAVDGAAREAARAVATAPDDAAAGQRAVAAVGLALRDQGLPHDAADALTVTCQDVCLTAGSVVTVQVAVEVALPGVPGWLQGAVPLSIPVTSTASAVVDSYVGRG